MRSIIACGMVVLLALAVAGPLLAQAPVNVNTATASELQAIKGIGPKTAQSIIDYRTEHGDFNSINDVTRVKRIGPKTLQKMIDSGAGLQPVGGGITRPS